jgi:hypothetical protein
MTTTWMIERLTGDEGNVGDRPLPCADSERLDHYVLFAAIFHQFRSRASPGCHGSAPWPAVILVRRSRITWRRLYVYPRCSGTRSAAQRLLEPPDRVCFGRQGPPCIGPGFRWRRGARIVVPEVSSVAPLFWGARALSGACRLRRSCRAQSFPRRELKQSLSSA